MFYYKNELKTQTENEKQNREYNSNRIQTTKNLHLPKSSCEFKDSVWKKMWSNNRSFPMNFKTLGYTQVQYERERLLVGNECESWESGHEVCDIFIGGKKMNNWWMKQINDEWVFVWRNREALLAPLSISQITHTHAICFIGCGK